MDLRDRTTLTVEEQIGVRTLADLVAAHDGVAALSEQTLLHLDAAAGDHRHVLAVEDGHVVGYAHLDHTDSRPGSEIAVLPGSRRRGTGSTLWGRVTGLAADARVWAHGDLPSAQGWAAAQGLGAVRELLRLARPLAGLESTDISLPDGYTVQAFTEADLQEWLALNARAFAHHPEQGRITADDVRARMAEPWFDPSGFLLVRRPAVEGGGLAGFHWTKTEHAEGEVYVVGVDPELHGRGLGKAATLLGLRHLARRGLPRVTLYVDGDNTAALATYEKLGFTRDAIDVMYGPATA